MANIDQIKTKPIEQFWEELDDVRAGMLRISGSHLHSQPMAPQWDEPNGSLYFFAKKNSEIASEIKPGAHAHFDFVSDDHDYFACVSGQLIPTDDKNKIDALWDKAVDAWYENGKDDENLILLEMKLVDGQAWATTDSAIKFGWEIAKANLTDEKPNLGDKTALRF